MRNPGAPTASPPCAAWRQRLADGRAALKAVFLDRGQPRRLLRDHARLVDSILRDIWRQQLGGSGCALAAAGGYGRAELFPESDIDLLILLPAPPDAALAAQLETLVGRLWDVGLAISHSVRTPEDCLNEARRDITTRTGLLEARFLAGDRQLFDRVMADARADIDPRAFCEAKILEQQMRHRRQEDVTYRLEPNLKDGPGGLRDLQTARWISHAAGLGQRWQALVAAGTLDAADARAAQRLERFLFDLRIRLHYLAGRREDRLAFDFQAELAAQMGCRPRGRRTASETLMQRYYRAAQAVTLLNDIVLLGLRERLAPTGDADAEPINARFLARRGLLEMAAPDLFLRQPDALLEAFHQLQLRAGLSGMSPATLRAVHRAAVRIDAGFRNDPVNRAWFMRILGAGQRVVSTLRQMNRYGVLGCYLPAFGRIVGQMQHDLYHVYAVDEHILFVLRNLRRFTLPELAHEFPLCSRLMSEFERPEILYVAALFHDIGKGRGGDHSRLGAREVRRFCRAHGVRADDADLAAWLVEHHLVMSATAQKRDIEDPAVIAAFARLAQDERRLTALYLLTVADIRGTSPKVWNAWKGKLLADLYHAALRHLHGESGAPERSLYARQRAALDELARQAVPPGVQEALWAQLDEGYFLRQDVGAIAWHTRVLNRFVHTTEPIVRARIDRDHGGIAVLTYLRDQPGLFARLCATFERLSMTIVDARVNTTRHGYALNGFVVLNLSHHAVRDRDLLSYIEYELRQSVAPDAPLPGGGMGRPSRRLKHFPVVPNVSATPDTQGVLHALSVTAGDRPGLLSTIAGVFVRHGVQLHTARINTLGERAIDVFLISGQEGPLSEPALTRLQQDLLAALDA